MQPVLRQIADRQAAWLDDEPAVRLFHAGEHLEQGRFAGAVRSAQTDPFAVVDLPADRIEEDPVAERLTEIGELDHDGTGVSADKRTILACWSGPPFCPARPKSPATRPRASPRNASAVVQGIDTVVQPD